MGDLAQPTRPAPVATPPHNVRAGRYAGASPGSVGRGLHRAAARRHRATRVLLEEGDGPLHEENNRRIPGERWEASWAVGHGKGTHGPTPGCRSSREGRRAEANRSDTVPLKRVPAGPLGHG